MRSRHIPVATVVEVHEDPDYSHPSEHDPDREIRGRQYDRQTVEIVVDLRDGIVASVWITRVE